MTTVIISLNIKQHDTYRYASFQKFMWTHGRICI